MASRKIVVYVVVTPKMRRAVHTNRRDAVDHARLRDRLNCGPSVIVRCEGSLPEKPRSGGSDE